MSVFVGMLLDDLWMVGSKTNYSIFNNTKNILLILQLKKVQQKMLKL